MKAGSLEVNTKTASRIAMNRFAWVPRGAHPETFSPEDLTIFKRALRWQRKHAVECLLSSDDKQKDKIHRVAKCYVMRIQKNVDVHYSPKIKRAHYGGLMICGRVWVCPLCAAKITERRRIELEKACVDGLSFFMVTITLQHNAKDKLKDLIEDLSQAWRKVTSGRGWQDIKAKYKLVGSVTGREVTYGLSNGWHPHLHVLYYSRLPLEKINTDSIRIFISDRFGLAVAKVGRYASPLRGVNVIKGNDITSKYVVKAGLEDDNKKTWSLISEITKAPAKIGMMRGEHYTPFQLVDLWMCGDRAAGGRFVEYDQAMRARKQLTYSRGLRELLKIGAEVTDQELAEAQDQEARLFAMLSPDGWRQVLKSGKRGALLEVVSFGDYSIFRNWCILNGVEDLPPEAS